MLRAGQTVSVQAIDEANRWDFAAEDRRDPLPPRPASIEPVDHLGGEALEPVQYGFERAHIA